MFEQGKQAHVPLLAGWNGAEKLLFLPRALPHNSAAEFKADLPLLFGSKTAEALNTPDLYPANTDVQANTSATALIGDLVIREQTWEVVVTQRSTGGGSAVFVYYFTYMSAYSTVAAHTAELPFVFGTLTNNPLIGSIIPPKTADRAFSKQVTSYWANFSKSSNPNGARLAAWPAYTSAGSTHIPGLGNTHCADQRQPEPLPVHPEPSQRPRAAGKLPRNQRQRGDWLNVPHHCHRLQPFFCRPVLRLA